MNHILGQNGQTPDFHAFGMQMVLGEADSGEAQVFHHARNLDDFVKHFLPALGAVGNGPQVSTLLWSGRN